MQLTYYMNHRPFYFQNKARHSTVPNADVFIVVFKVYVNYFILKFNSNEFNEKPYFELIRNWINFRLGSFLYQDTLWQKIQNPVSYKLASYVRVLTLLCYLTSKDPLMKKKHIFLKLL